MSQYNTVENYYQDDEFNVFYKETYDPMVKGRTYFSGNISETVTDPGGVTKLPVNRNIIVKGGLTYNSNGSVNVVTAGTYAVSGRLFVSDQAWGRYNLSIKKNSNVSLCESMSHSCQSSRNMDGNGAQHSYLNVYNIVHLNAGDNIYMTIQDSDSGLRRFNENSGMELFLLQADL